MESANEGTDEVRGETTDDREDDLEELSEKSTIKLSEWDHAVTN